MGFTKLEKDVLNISKLPDSVKGNAKDLKATFDKAGEDIKKAHNDLIDELEEQNAASKIGAISEEGATTVQAELDKLNKRIKIDYTELEVVVDDKLSEDSENAVQNKVITEETKRLQENIDRNNKYVVFPDEYDTEEIEENKYNKNYHLDGVEEPKVGQKLDLWKKSEKIKIIGEKSIYSDTLQIKRRADGKYFVLVAYTSSKLSFEIYDENFNHIETKELADTATSEGMFDFGADNCIYLVQNKNISKYDAELNLVASISFTTNSINNRCLCCAANGNVFLSYTDGSTSSVRRRIVYDKNLIAIVSLATMFNSPAKYGTSIKTPDNKVFEFYSHNSGWANGTSGCSFSIWNEDGSSYKATTKITANNAQQLASCISKNGNVCLTYYDSTDKNNKLVIFDSEGNYVLEPTTIINDGEITVFSLMSSGDNILFAYSSGNAVYSLFDENGNQIVGLKGLGDFCNRVSGIEISEGKNVICTRTSGSILSINVFKPEQYNYVTNSINGILINKMIDAYEKISLIYDGEKYLLNELAAKVVCGTVSISSGSVLRTISLGFKPDLVICYSATNNANTTASSTSDGSYAAMPRVLSEAYKASGNGCITEEGFTLATSASSSIYYIAIKF